MWIFLPRRGLGDWLGVAYSVSENVNEDTEAAIWETGVPGVRGVLGVEAPETGTSASVSEADDASRSGGISMWGRSSNRKLSA